MKAKLAKNILLISLSICLGSTALAYGSIHDRYDRKGRIFWHGPANLKKVALTFDDGPSEYTLRILDILKENNVKATFFVVGKNVDRYPQIFKRIVKDGHVIGNHSYSHPYMFLKSSATIRQEIENTEAVVRKFSDKKMFLLRTPYGVENPWVFSEAKNHGYTLVKWSVGGSDWRTTNSDKIVKKIVDNVHNGSIINLHDARRLKIHPHCQSTVNALPKIIASLKQKGYQFLTVPQLLVIKPKLADKI